MQKASIGVRFGALILDGIFLDFIFVFILFLDPYIFFLLLPFGTFLYYGICEGSSMSASLGKKLCGLIVVDEYGNKLTSAKGFLRSLCRLISSALFGIGFFIALFDEEGKALHDKMAKTFVTTAASFLQPVPVAASVNMVQPAGVPSNMVQPASAPVNRYQASSTSSNNNPKVICIAGQFAGKAFQIGGQGITLGRDSNVCEYAFSENTKGISRIHCKIQFNPQTQMFVLYDLGSTYGTYLENGIKVMQGQPVAINSGEGFYLASRDNLFRVNL